MITQRPNPFRRAIQITRPTQRVLVWGTLLALALPFACAPLPTGKDIEDAVEDFAGGGDLNLPGFGGMGGLPIDIDVDVSAVLKVLFPDMSAEEIGAAAASLTLEEALRLRDELEAARKEAEEFSRDLFKRAEEASLERNEALESERDGFPDGLGALGLTCNYDAGSRRVEVLLSGVYDTQESVALASSEVNVLVDGVVQPGELNCLADGDTVDIVFLIDITGSMSNVIGAVRDSVVRFVASIEESGLRGTVSAVTFQDTVGVNVTFQEPAPPQNLERSPFFPPVSIADEGGVSRLRSFVERLEANLGSDAPENLAGAIDFARNNTIGGTEKSPNVIDGSADPPGTSPFPKLTSDRQVFVALTDIGFHPDASNASNSSLKTPFDPRSAQAIVTSLQQSGSVVHVIDPSWADYDMDPTSSTSSMTDSDFWAQVTGGLGEDYVKGYSLMDLESVIVSKEAALLDVHLDSVLATTCSYQFTANLSASAEVEVRLEVDGQIFSKLLKVHSF
jgi:hypothetical protein